MDKQFKAINLHSPKYPLGHGASILFEQEFEFDYHLDYTDMTGEKSFPVERDQLRTLYNSESFGYWTGKPTTGRCVREFLRREMLDIKSICDTIRLRMTPENWKIVIIHAKEITIYPRLFAMMGLEMRLYFYVTEQNISHFIFMYFPRLAVNESELTKRLLSISHVPKFIQYRIILLGIYYYKWNIRWTNKSTFPFFHMLDQFFGTPGLYTCTHRFFPESAVSLASYYNPPRCLVDQPYDDLEECDTLRYNHMGGFEDLGQKGWTEHQVGLKSYIGGQGDNQICRLHLPKSDL
jgi:hypothetical protein